MSDNPIDNKIEEDKRAAQFFQWPIVEFFKSGAAGGIVLIVAMVVALAWVNSPWGHSYHAFWHIHGGFNIGTFGIHLSLEEWVSDALMAIFFFHVGLEIKREMMTGELSSGPKAALPMMGALGGMIVPALIYTALNFGTEAIHGWGIPMATDIAFALGVLVLLGDRVPLGLKVFLTALAIVDDLGAVLVIAVFYTSQLNLVALAIGGGLLIVLAVGNRLHVRRRLFYVGIGVVVWYFFLQSGVHATVAGVLVAMTVPHKILGDRMKFLRTAGDSLKALELVPEDADEHSTREQRQVALSAIEKSAEHWGSPLHRMEHDLSRYVVFFIMPLFALANSGVVVDWKNIGSILLNPVPMGICAGLALGKVAGILSFSWIAVKTGMAKLPRRVNFVHMTGAAILGGIGFTMSLFITNLAFGKSEFLDYAKVGILTGSFISAIVGSIYMRVFIKSEKRYPEREVMDFSGR